jgi:lipopolysaccharide transport system permease protein
MSEGEQKIITEYEIKPQNKLSLGLAELWQYRELFYFFTWRDIKVKYKQTALGFAWAIIQPLVMTLLLTFGFGKMISANNSLGMPYPLFAISGLVIWNIFSSGLSSAGNSMVSNANIIKKIYFPRLIIPISSVLVSLFDFLMAFLIFVVMLFYYKVDINILYFLGMLVSSIILTCIATFGSGSLLAALNIKYRDFRYVIPFMIQALLFLTPVIYPLSITNNQLVKHLLALNPMYAPIELFRFGIVQQHIEMHFIFLSMISSLILFFTGLYYFRKTESYFADLA